MIVVEYKTITTESEYPAVESFTTYNSALNRYFNLLTNVTSDPDVLKFDINIQNDDLIELKHEHYVKDAEGPLG